MIKKEIKYENYEGEEKTMTAWFHLSKSELAEFNFKFEGGLDGAVKKAQESGDAQAILSFLKELVTMAYGKRSDDGESFFKDDYKYGKQFVNGPAYDALFIELIQGEGNELAEFVLGMLPRDLARQVEPQVKNAITE